MARTVLITTFGAFLINIAVVGVFALLPVEEPGVTSFISVAVAAAFASDRFVKRNGRIMEKAERWKAGLYSGLLMILLSVVLLVATFLVVTALDNADVMPLISTLLGEIDLGMTTLLVIVVVGLSIYLGIHMLVAYFGYGMGQKNADKILAQRVDEAFE